MSLGHFSEGTDNPNITAENPPVQTAPPEQATSDIPVDSGKAEGPIELPARFSSLSVDTDA